MKTNVGNTDRIIRVILAIVAFTAYFSNLLPDTLGIVALVAGVIFLLTGLVAFCPLYAIFGLNTCRIRS
jgi:hypothetical protein